MKKKILYRYLLIAFLSVSIIFVTSVLAVYFSNKDMVENRLMTETELVQTLVTEQDDFNKLDGYGKDNDLRITIVSMDGKVLFDTNTTAELENHLDREEVKSAINGTPKVVERYSDTFKCTMTYSAIKDTLSDGTDVIIRLSVRSSDMTGFIIASIIALVVAFIVALIIAILFSKKLSNRVSNKIVGIAASLRSLNEGQYKPLETDSSEPELYAVFNEINEINKKTYNHIVTEEEEKTKFNIVLDNIQEGIIALNNNDEIVFVNTKANEMFKCQENIVSKNISYFIEDSEILKNIKNNTKKEEDTIFEYDYNDMVLSFSICKVKDSMLANTISNIIVITDITKEREVERQKSEFFANASHELKTPITVMQGLTEVLMTKDDIPENEKKKIERVHKESLRLAHLVLDMLKLSSLERNEVDNNIVDINIADVAKEVLSELQNKIEEKQIKTTITGNGIIKADYKDIYELIENLCSNAVNYNKVNGKININIKKQDNNIKLEVEDTGIGIEKEHIPRLCERFYRVDKSRSKKTGGTGLGLAIVKHICAKYNALLNIESEINEGTKIQVIFNLQ